jgi:hypothetical protein
MPTTANRRHENCPPLACLPCFLSSLPAPSGGAPLSPPTCSGPTGSTVYLTSTFLDSARSPPAPIHVIQALEAATGALVWQNTTALAPASGLPTSDTATTGGVTPLPGLSVFAQGPRLYGISAEDGKELWSMIVSAGPSTGLSANVTSIAYVEPSPPQRPDPLLLLTTLTFDQTRYMAYKLNGSFGQPPAVAWQMSGSQNFEGSLAEGLVRLGLQEPQVSAVDNVFVAWSNRTSEWGQARGGRGRGQGQPSAFAAPGWDGAGWTGSASQQHWQRGVHLSSPAADCLRCKCRCPLTSTPNGPLPPTCPPCSIRFEQRRGASVQHVPCRPVSGLGRCGVGQRPEPAGL